MRSGGQRRAAARAEQRAAEAPAQSRKHSGPPCALPLLPVQQCSARECSVCESVCSGTSGTASSLAELHTVLRTRSLPATVQVLEVQGFSQISALRACTGQMKTP